MRITPRRAFRNRDVAASERAHQYSEKHPEVGEYLGDLVLGGIDGIVTTFAIVAGVEGAALSSGVVVILGLANLLADGFSMAGGNYLGARSDQDFESSERDREEWEIEHLPHLEEEEVREIYSNKGFKGEILDRIVAHIVADKDLWVETMMREELGIISDKKSALKSGVATFLSFILFGSIPLIFYVIAYVLRTDWSYFIFPSTCFATAFGLFLVGALRSLFTFSSSVRSGLEILLVGGLAGGMSYLIGYLLRSLV